MICNLSFCWYINLVHSKIMHKLFHALISPKQSLHNIIKTMTIRIYDFCNSNLTNIFVQPLTFYTQRIFQLCRKFFSRPNSPVQFYRIREARSRCMEFSEASKWQRKRGRERERERSEGKKERKNDSNGRTTQGRKQMIERTYSWV